MAIFFFVVGLEIKREVLVGELASPRRAALPAIAALGGVLVPAVIYLAINRGHAGSEGWGIPMATDIAFALGVLALVGSNLPSSLKVFLTSLAIIDDLGAILIIATFYASDLSFAALGIAAVFAATLYWLNRRGETRLLPYAVLGFLLWLAMLYSGIHASLAGVILAMMIPINHNSEGKDSLLHTVERGLSKWVAYLVLPIFGFANAGVSISSTGHMSLISPLGMGIIAGLFLGKQFGVLAAVYLAKQAGIAVLPKGATWGQIYGVAVLCGIGFTMSLFIGLLAFDDPAKEAVLKLSVLAGSLLSALVGALILMTAGPAETKRSG